MSYFCASKTVILQAIYSGPNKFSQMFHSGSNLHESFAKYLAAFPAMRCNLFVTTPFCKAPHGEQQKGFALLSGLGYRL